MKLFVWDLHGTLEQGNENAVIVLSNQILRRHGYREQFTAEHVSMLYGNKWYEYFEFLLPGEPHEKHIELQADCFLLSNQPEGVAVIAHHMRPARNALLILDTIAKSHHQVLISNTTPASLPIFIDALGIADYFDTKTNAIAVNQHVREAKHTKQEALAQYVRGKKYDELIVIGDSESDMHLARDVGAVGYLYTHAGSPFRSELGDYKIDDLKLLLQRI